MFGHIDPCTDMCADVCVRRGQTLPSEPAITGSCMSDDIRHGVSVCAATKLCIVMAYTAMACIVTACIVLAYTAMACIVTACIVIAYTAMACIVTACIVLAYRAMACMVMACRCVLQQSSAATIDIRFKHAWMCARVPPHEYGPMPSTCQYEY